MSNYILTLNIKLNMYIYYVYQMDISSGELLRVVPLSHGTILGGVQLNMIIAGERPFGS